MLFVYVHMIDINPFFVDNDKRDTDDYLAFYLISRPQLLDNQWAGEGLGTTTENPGSSFR